MPTLLWDQTGSRVYESGIDRGVLYLPDGGAVPWNGLISVTEKSPTSAGTPVYFDGTKYGDALNIGDYSATIKAYTYPDEFLEFEGIIESGNGLFLANQRPSRFGLSYRTRIGDDASGDTAGYKIHVVYNLTAIPVDKNYNTSIGSNVTEFSWNVTAIPEVVSGFRPTAHIVLDTRKMGALLLQDLEDTLYGDGVTIPTLPPIETLVSFISDWVVIRIVDNNDGTWTAIVPDQYLTMLDATTFEITQANAVYLDANSYNVSDTTY